MCVKYVRSILFERNAALHTSSLFSGLQGASIPWDFFGQKVLPLNSLAAMPATTPARTESPWK